MKNQRESQSRFPADFLRRRMAVCPPFAGGGYDGSWYLPGGIFWKYL